MTKAVIFDCFGVLYGGSLFALLNMIPAERHQELIDLNKQNDYGYIDFSTYIEGVANILGKTAGEVTEIFAQKRVRNQLLFDYITRLRSEGVKIGLLTNAGRDMPSTLFTESELNGELFDAYIVSSEEGIAKPNPEIYTLMASKLGVPAGDCTMVDDTAENCEGAEIAGMKSVWFTDTRTAIARLNEQLL